MLTAKLLVAEGAPLQLSDGETLPPLQPKPLNTCSLAMVAPSLISALVTVMSWAHAAPAPNRLTAQAEINPVAANFVMAIPPSVSRDFLSRIPQAKALSNFCSGAEGSGCIR